MPFSRFGHRRLPPCSALLVACLLAGVCAAGDYDPDLDLWPLLYVSRDAAKDERIVEVFGPFIEYRGGPARRVVAVRPFYWRGEDKPARRVESERPWPLAFGTRTDNLYNSWFFPLWHHEADLSPDGEAKRRKVYLLPFLIYRAADEEKDKLRDLLVWPFGGRLHDWYDREKITVIAWPLYVHQHSEEADSWDAPFPFVTVVRWQDGGRGFRLWPLYGRNLRPDRLDKRFVLWPIYTRVWAKDEHGREIDRWMLFPFYGSLEAPGSRTRVWLWPFFGHSVDGAAGEERADYPWPFLGHVRGLEGKPVSGGRLWPLYVWENRGHRRSRQFLWPFGWYDSVQPQEDGDERGFSFRLLPFLFHAREERTQEDRTPKEDEPLFFWERGRGEGAAAANAPPDAGPRQGRAVPEDQEATPSPTLAPGPSAGGKGGNDGGQEELLRTGVTVLWPLYRWERTADGVEEQEVLSLWPGRGGGGWSRNWAPLFRVWHRERADDGRVSTSVLWRLIRSERTPTDRFFEVKPLLRVHRRFPEEPKNDILSETDWRVLGGLVGRESREGRRSLRLLWLFRVPLGRDS